MESSADVSTLAASPISTFVRHYVPCTQVDIGLAARVDTRPRTPSSVGFVYVCMYVCMFIDIYIHMCVCVDIYITDIYNTRYIYTYVYSI